MRHATIAGIALATLCGCAGSATHKVLTSYEENDVNLSCAEIDAEIAKAQDVIDAVNQDKEDISGKDVIDGLLWFPFNLIAKSSNYNTALKAADGRVERLTALKQEKDCGA
ncbi:MAG: hypothetical protein HYY48_07795 [Gammaproteobacteria bacterium]|nr:hypothetical protein [Gammaproteobacteria bacterium]